MAGASSSAELTSATPTWPAATVLHGLCGWTDEGLTRSGFYPAAAKTSSAEQLRHYSRHLPCVEVDTSTYAIPTVETTTKWAAATAPNFLFHVKAFGIFAATAVPLNSLPRAVRELPCMCAFTNPSARYAAEDLPRTALDELWTRFHDCLRPLSKAKKLGVVVVQYQSSFAPSAETRRIVEACRSRLAPNVQMAVEFRHRGWLHEGAALEATLEWLSTLRVTLIASDDLLHEMQQRDRAQTGLPSGSSETGPTRLPVHIRVSDERALYVRVHRRHGPHRLLPEDVMQGYVDTLSPRSVHDTLGLRGPCFFLWGNSWLDQPIVSARTLAQRLALAAQADADSGCVAAVPLRENVLSTWQRRTKEAAPASSLLGMLRASPKPPPQAAAPPATPPPAAAAPVVAVPVAAPPVVAPPAAAAPAAAPVAAPAPAPPPADTSPAQPATFSGSSTPIAAAPPPADATTTGSTSASSSAQTSDTSDWVARAQKFNGGAAPPPRPSGSTGSGNNKKRKAPAAAAQGQAPEAGQKSLRAFFRKKDE